MKVYRLDIKVWATAYIKAENEQDAFQKAKLLENNCINEHDGESEVEFCSMKYDDPDLPEISLSPVMTIAPIPDNRIEHLECVEELE